jgi:hypothetical protein
MAEECQHTEAGRGDGQHNCSGCQTICRNCGHARSWHRENVIPEGKYGAGGRCGWWKDPMFGPVEECSGCSGFAAS